LDKFQRADVLTKNGHEIDFGDENARFFTAGGWLEDHVFDVIKRLKGVQDTVKSLEIRRGRSKNEIDVAFLVRNALFLVECKARNFLGPDKSIGAQAVYKLDSLVGLGGLRTRGILISYRPLRDADQTRAKDLQIDTVVGSEIGQLAKKMDQIIRG